MEGEGEGSGCKRQRQYKGVRMRKKWSKWVAQIREPRNRSRIWLGSYSTPVAAARAYDTAAYYLRGPSARVNFPELLPAAEPGHDFSNASISIKAIEVGSRVDALLTSGHEPSQSKKPDSFQEKPDLNKTPEPEFPDDD